MNEKTYHKSFEKILACENILEKVKVRKPDLMNLALVSYISIICIF